MFIFRLLVNPDIWPGGLYHYFKHYNPKMAS